MSGSFQANSAGGPGQSGDPSMEDILASIRRILSEDDARPAAGTDPAPLARPAPDDVLALDESMLVREPTRHADPAAHGPAPTAAGSLSVHGPASNGAMPNGLSAGPLAALGSFMTAPTQPNIVAPPTAQDASLQGPQHIAERIAGKLHDDNIANAHPPSDPRPASPRPSAPPAESADQYNEPAFVQAHPAAPPRAERLEIPVERLDDVIPLVAPEAVDAASASMTTLRRAITAERHTPVHRGGPTLEDMMREEMRPMLKEWLDINLPGLVERLVKAEIDRVSGRAAAL